MLAHHIGGLIVPIGYLCIFPGIPMPNIEINIVGKISFFIKIYFHQDASKSCTSNSTVPSSMLLRVAMTTNLSGKSNSLA